MYLRSATTHSRCVSGGPGSLHGGSSGPWTSLAWRPGHQVMGGLTGEGIPVLLFARGGLPQALPSRLTCCAVCGMWSVSQVPVLPVPFLWHHWRAFGPVAGLVSSWLSRGACTGALGQEASKPEAHVPSPPPPRRPTRGPCQAGTASGHCPR